MGTGHRTILVDGLLTLAGFSVLAAYEPAILSLAISVGAALGWCLWLDRDPGS